MKRTGFLCGLASFLFCASLIAFVNCGSPTESTPPAVAPAPAAGYPKAATGTADGVAVKVMYDRAGTAFWVAVPKGDNTPTTANIKAGQDNSRKAAPFSGKVTVTANAEATIAVAAKDGKQYDVYVVAADAANADLVQDPPSKVTITTIVAVPPVNAAGYPKTKGDVAATGEILVQTDKAGKAYVVVVAKDAKAPTATQVKAGQNGDGVAVATGLSANVTLVANTEAALALSGLTAQTAYDAYVVAEDAVPNVQTPVKVSFTTVGGAAGEVFCRADDSAFVYLNGDSIGLAKKSPPSSAYPMTPKAGKNVLAVQLVTIHKQWGSAWMALATWNLKKDSLKTDSTWKYSFVAPAGWNKVGFDDAAWFPARELAYPGVMQATGDSGAVASVDSVAKWLYVSSDKYYRKQYTAAAAGKAQILSAGMQKYEVYINEKLVWTGDSVSLSSLKAHSDTVDLVAGKNTIAIHGVDYTKGDFGGNVIVEMRVIGTTDTIRSDSTWKCYPKEVTGWTTAAFDDAGWFKVENIGDYTLSVLQASGKPLNRLVGGASQQWLKDPLMGPSKVGTVVAPATKARWISLPYNIYFRKEFTVK